MQRTRTFLLDVTQRTKYFCQRCCYYVYSGWFWEGSWNAVEVADRDLDLSVLNWYACEVIFCM